MNRRLHQHYFPLTVPFPERLANWRQIISYGKARVKRGNPVSKVLYQIPAPAAAGRKIAFLADAHFRGTPADFRIAESAAEAIAAFEPDVLLTGGDLVADGCDVRHLPDLLKILAEAAPVRLAVPGNWERGKFWMPISLWNKLFEQAGFQFLCNQSWRDDTLYVYGCDDVGRGTPRLPGVWPSRQTVILLAHNPDTVIALDNGDAFDGVRLACCGHTHGGQVRLPFIGPLFTPSRYNCRFAYGEFRRRKTDTRMIVTSGLGNLSLPWRFRCRREVVFIRFTGC